MNPIVVAARAKGLRSLLRRTGSLARRYGLTPLQMDEALRRYSEILDRFGCQATLPITAVCLKRHLATVAKYMGKNIEFAVHGFTHIDYSRLSPEQQADHLQRAHAIFIDAGVSPSGFRSPYYSRDANLNAALERAGFAYVSNQPILWETPARGPRPSSATYGYKQALEFFNPWQAGDRPSLPRQAGRMVEIPVSLPDDEMLVERLRGADGLVEETWRDILEKTYQSGELFVLQLHPERIALCAGALSVVLTEAQTHRPGIWIAQLEEIAAWWKNRADTSLDVTESVDGEYRCSVNGPAGTTVLARGLDVVAPSIPWVNGFREVKADRFSFKCPRRPFIGVTPSTPKALTVFLRQQGYIVEIATEADHYSFAIDQGEFDASHEKALLARIEGSSNPILRFGRWPYGNLSALAISGDIDALTLLDYSLRVFGK